MQVQTLISHPRHRVSAHFPAQPSDTLVITFNPIRKGLSETGFGSGLIQWLGFTHIFVSEGADSLYQELMPDDLLQAVAPIAAQHDKVFLYGSSLGGHAALYYANWLKARAVAISPRLPAHPYFRPFLTAGAKRLARVPLHHRDLPQVADPSLSPIVLHDPWTEADEIYVDQFVRPAYPDAWFIPVRGAGHRVARVLAYQHLLKPMLTDIFVHNRLPTLNYELGGRPRRDLTLANRALDHGDDAAALRWLFRVMRDPATPGLADAMARYRGLAGQAALH
jgi:hypothetical protein